jgi:hypothetical protein
VKGFRPANRYIATLIHVNVRHRLG